MGGGVAGAAAGTLAAGRYLAAWTGGFKLPWCKAGLLKSSG